MGMNTDIIRILSDHINNEPSEVVVTPELEALGRSHQVLPIIYYQTKDDSLRLNYLQAINTYTQRKALLDQIAKAFSDIPFYTVKGIAVSMYYPLPQLRTMGDCDIIVHEDDKDRAKQVLLSIGFNYVETKWDSTEWHFEKQGLDFELHHRLLYDEIVNSEEEKALTDTAWNYVQNHELDVNFHFVFLLIHLKKHLLNRGVGLRQFMDLTVMSKNADLDPDVISELLKLIGLEKFAGVCSALCLRWFGLSLPVETQELSDDFYNYATDLILTNGVFGFDNPENKDNSLLNSVSKHGKVGSIIRKFFPSYEGCVGTVKYKWIKGKPYLMPILWMYRPFEFFFLGKISKGFEHISSVSGSDKSLAARNKELSAWGLLGD